MRTDAPAYLAQLLRDYATADLSDDRSRTAVRVQMLKLADRVEGLRTPEEQAMVSALTIAETYLVERGIENPDRSLIGRTQVLPAIRAALAGAPKAS